MSATLLELRTAVRSAVRDPSPGKTFTDSAVTDMVNSGLAEVSLYAPEPYEEAFSFNTLANDTFTLRSVLFGGANADISLARVEVWSEEYEPAHRLLTVPAASAGYDADSQSGWTVWGGVLLLPAYVWSAYAQDPNAYIRVWGYSPYLQLASDSDVAAISPNLKWAVIAYARVEALEMLNADRDLFTQWQTRAGNSDISPAGLMNMLSMARQDWRRRSRAIQRLRTTV